MKPILALVISLAAVALGCTREETGPLQDRLNRYFHSEVTPKLQPCWGRVQGEGRIEVKLSFARAGTRWAWQKVEINRTTLPREQDAAALQCMVTAIRGTSFPAEERADETGFVINWGWPVPLPANGSMLATRMISEGGGGGNCENPSCFETTCTDNKCPTAKNCSGFADCTVTDSGDGSLQCNFKNKCLSSGYFRGGGGLIMY